MALTFYDYMWLALKGVEFVYGLTAIKFFLRVNLFSCECMFEHVLGFVLLCTPLVTVVQGFKILKRGNRFLMIDLFYTFMASVVYFVCAFASMYHMDMTRQTADLTGAIHIVPPLFQMTKEECIRFWWCGVLYIVHTTLIADTMLIELIEEFILYNTV